MNLSKHFNVLMASAVSVSLAASPLSGLSIAHAQNAPAAEAPGDSGWQKEFELWRTASKAGKAQDYEAYLKAYPTGKFASVAKKRIAELDGTGDTAAAEDIDAQKTADVAQADTDTKTPVAGDDEKRRDLEMWRQVSKSGKQADYEKYLKEFPKGKFAKVAKTRLTALTAEAAAPEPQETDTADAADDAAPAQDTQAQDMQAQNDAAEPADDTAAQVTEKADDAPDASDWEQEYALWKAASNGNTVVEYEAYLSAYPKGKFAAIAQARIVQLAAAEQPVANVDEGDAAQNDTMAKPVDQQANKQQQFDDAGQMDQADSDQQADDQQMARSDASDMQDDGAQNQQQDRKQVQFTEGTPDTEDAVLDREGRHEIQGRLTSLGYDTRGTDGAFGPNSRDAIAGWQQDAGAPVTGYLSEDQVEEIRAQSEQSYAEWLNSQPVVTERVRPRREKVVVVEERNPALDAAVAVGVIGAVVGATKLRRGKVKVVRPGSIKLIGKFKLGGCNKKKRRC